MAKPLLVYTCFDPADDHLAKELGKHLSLLEKRGLVQLWNESLITPGTARQEEIDRYLGRADIVLLLVSASFLASDHCSALTDRALLRYHEKQTIVIPVLVRPSMWKSSPFQHLKPLPDGEKPVTGWSDRDDAWFNVVSGISQVVNRQVQNPPAPLPPKSASVPIVTAPIVPAPTPTVVPVPQVTPPAFPIPLFAWIQVSDLHFGHGDATHGWDQVLVTSALRTDVRALLQQDIPAPDAVLVTGDVGFSGDTRPRPGGRPSQEYADAKKFLLGLGQAAGLAPQNIFVVPGNHDVQRSADQDRGLKRLVGAIRSGTESLDEVLANQPDREQLALRQANYLRFAADFAPAVLGPATPPEERLWWCHQAAGRGGLTVRLIGLNTALLAADDQDKGKLRLGKEVLGQVLAAPPPQADELLVVLTHHPLRGGWLADQKESDGWIRNTAHIHLCGHVHEADSEDARSGASGSFVRVVAGAAHGDPAAADGSSSHGYNFAAVMAMADGSLTLRIWPRRWSDKSKAFRSDTNNLPDRQEFADHPLRLRLERLAKP